MMRKIILCVVMVVIGGGIGFGSAMLVTKPKMEKSNAQIAELQSQVQRTEIALQDKSRSSDARISQLTMELMQVRQELEVAKSAAATTVIKAVESTKLPAMNANEVTSTIDASIPTVEYTIKDGDSFWSIAQSQLGNGDRAKEISKLNPDAASRKYLIVGSKLRLPAK